MARLAPTGWPHGRPVLSLRSSDLVFGGDTPMKRPAQPEEVAPACVFFASEADSSCITGEVLTLLGGDTTAA